MEARRRVLQEPEDPRGQPQCFVAGGNATIFVGIYIASIVDGASASRCVKSAHEKKHRTSNNSCAYMFLYLAISLCVSVSVYVAYNRVLL